MDDSNKKRLNYIKVSGLPKLILIVGVAELQPYPIIIYISINYNLKNLTVDRLVDGILNELKAN